MPSKTRPKRGYHHRDLREALIKAALQVLEARGIEGFSLREVGRQAGVSPHAPYHHFPDRAALLAAIAERGFDQLGAALKRAAEEAASPSAAFRAMIDVYVGFAMQERGYFEVMFRPNAYDKEQHPEVAIAGDRALAIVTDAVAAFDPGATAVQTHTLTMLAWTVAHGAASLLLDGAFDRRSEAIGTTPRELVDHVAGAFTDLLRPRRAR